MLSEEAIYIGGLGWRNVLHDQFKCLCCHRIDRQHRHGTYCKYLGDITIHPTVHPAAYMAAVEQRNTRLPSHLQVECFHKLQLAR